MVLHREVLIQQSIAQVKELGAGIRQVLQGIAQDILMFPF